MTSNPKNKKIMIVDDDKQTRDMLKIALELKGYKVSVAPNGLRLISNLNIDQPNLILLDVMMSWIDGFELCKSVKINKEYKHIPIAFISARTSSEDVEEGYASGCDYYFTKPIDLEFFFEKVKELIE